MKYETLHCHTTASDGDLSYKSVLDTCREKSIKIVAFTDHDTLIDQSAFTSLKTLEHEVQFISGIEISADSVKEVEGKIGLFHIVGLFVDPTNQALIDYCTAAKVERKKRAELIVKNLKNHGFSISIDDINAFTGGDVVGRPHIVKALLAKEANMIVLYDIARQLQKMSQTDETLREKYEQVSSHNTWQKVFDLILSDDAFIKDIYVPYGKKVTLDDATRFIRSAGGISVLAHWTYYKNRVPAELVELFCKEHRLDGLETVYAIDKNDIGNETFKKDMDFLTGLVKKYDLIEGGGGDFHRAADFDLISDSRVISRMERTAGFTEKILTRYPGIDRRWSTVEI